MLIHLMTTAKMSSNWVDGVMNPLNRYDLRFITVVSRGLFSSKDLTVPFNFTHSDEALRAIQGILRAPITLPALYYE